jgi:hypothetical protein
MISQGMDWISNSFRIIPILFKNLFYLQQFMFQTYEIQVGKFQFPRNLEFSEKHCYLLKLLIERDFYQTMNIILPITNELISSNAENFSSLFQLLNDIKIRQIDNDFHNEWFHLLEKYHFFETIFEMDAKFHSHITIAFTFDYIDILIKNYPMQVKKLSEQFIENLNLFHFKCFNGTLISILDVDNQMDGELMVDRNKIMVLVSEYLSEVESVQQIDDLIFHLFSKELSTNDETCILVLNQILELINIDLLSGELKIITHIFNCLQLDAFPCFQKSFQLCLRSLGEIFLINLNHHQMEDLLDLIYKLIRIFGKEVEQYISNTNFLEMINQLSKVSLIHFQQRLILHLLFLTIF